MPSDKSSNRNLLLELLKEIKKIQLDLESLREEVAYIKKKTKEDNISIVKEEDPVVQSWFWQG